MCAFSKPTAWFSFVAAMAALCAVANTPSQVIARPIYLTGHSDVGVEYEDSKLILHYHIHNGAKDEQGNPLEGEFQPNELYTRVPDASMVIRPAGSAWDFLGVTAGSPVWILPATQEPGMPFLGFGTEHLDDEQWSGNIPYKLIGLDGPGAFSMWTTDMFGTPAVYWQSSNGIDASDTYSLGIPVHSHANWGFTAEGVYKVTIEASGTHVDDGPMSNTEVFTFLVGNSTVPEPGTIALLASGAGAALFGVWRRRRNKTRRA